MVSRKEMVQYRDKHGKAHPEVIQSEILKVKELMKKLPELLDEPEPAPAPAPAPDKKIPDKKIPDKNV